MSTESRVFVSRAGGAGSSVKSAKDTPPLSSSLTSSSPSLVDGLLSDSVASVAVAARALKDVEWPTSTSASTSVE